MWPVALSQDLSVIVRACPYCDRVDLFPKVNRTHVAGLGPYDQDNDPSL